jgi:predicted nucleic acid-binding protein
LSVVVDSSVLVAAMVDAGPEGAWAEKIIASGSLHTTEMTRAEASDVLRRLELAKHVATSEANAAHQDLLRLHLEQFPFDPFADRVWQLRHTVTSYDAWYVAVAEALNLPLATLDTRLAKASGPMCSFLTPP